MPVSTSLWLTPADSARAVGEVYGVSLLATVPLLFALLGILLLRRSSAGTRVLVWRSAVVAMLVVYLGRFLPFHWMAWVVPEGLAAPLVALGRAQLAVLETLPRVAVSDGAPGGAAVRGILVIYCTGAALVVLVMMAARWRLSRVASGASPLTLDSWPELLAHVLTTLMQDTRWESRAFAVVRLAQRPDSVEVARDASRNDPDPQVRAWARYALAQRTTPRVAVRTTSR